MILCTCSCVEEGSRKIFDLKTVVYSSAGNGRTLEGRCQEILILILTTPQLVQVQTRGA